MCCKALNLFDDAHKSVAVGLSSSTLSKYNKAFCTWFCIHPNLQYINYLIPFLHIFADCVQSRVLAGNRLPISNKIVEKYLRSMGVIFVAVGTKDPTFNSADSLSFSLGQQLAYYVHKDPPP